jgi:hypothetical protein
MLPASFDMTNFEDVSLYSCTQYDFMKTADELLSSATFADCTIDQARVSLHEIIMEGRYFLFVLINADEGSLIMYSFLHLT